MIIVIGYRVRSNIETNFRKWATHGHTAAEIIVERANAKRDFIGLTSFYPTKEDAEIANNIIFIAFY